MYPEDKALLGFGLVLAIIMILIFSIPMVAVLSEYRLQNACQQEHGNWDSDHSTCIFK